MARHRIPEPPFKKLAEIHALTQSKAEPGMKFDGDKTPIHLFPGDALFAICTILDFGQKKYEARNWERGMSWSRAFSACMRHMWQWWHNKTPTTHNFLFGDLDSETGYSHLWHAGCCIVFLIAWEIRGMNTYDDRPVHNDLYEPQKPFSWKKGKRKNKS